MVLMQSFAAIAAPRLEGYYNPIGLKERLMGKKLS